MKKLILISLLSGFSLLSNAQSLAYTEWFGTNPPSMNLYFRFEADTLFYSTGSGYTPLSLYTASGGIFTIADLAGTAPCMDTGNYNYSIAGNQLAFSLIHDSCVSRKNTLINYTWTFIGSTGFSSLPEFSEINVFPNPSENGIFTLSIPNYKPGKNEFTLFDINGKVIIKQYPETSKSIYDISFLPHGIYIGNYRSFEDNARFIIVR